MQYNAILSFLLLSIFWVAPISLKHNLTRHVNFWITYIIIIDVLTLEGTWMKNTFGCINVLAESIHYAYVLSHIYTRKYLIDPRNYKSETQIWLHKGMVRAVRRYDSRLMPLINLKSDLAIQNVRMHHIERA